jgi:hypothetical protein
MKQSKPREFNTMVDLLAGDALLRLVKGDQWRSIIFSICCTMAQWAKDEEPRLR